MAVLVLISMAHQATQESRRQDTSRQMAALQDELRVPDGRADQPAGCRGALADGRPRRHARSVSRGRPERPVVRGARVDAGARGGPRGGSRRRTRRGRRSGPGRSASTTPTASRPRSPLRRPTCLPRRTAPVTAARRPSPLRSATARRRRCPASSSSCRSTPSRRTCRPRRRSANAAAASGATPAVWCRWTTCRRNWRARRRRWGWRCG